MFDFSNGSFRKTSVSVTPFSTRSVIRVSGGVFGTKSSATEAIEFARSQSLRSHISDLKNKAMGMMKDKDIGKAVLTKTHVYIPAVESIDFSYKTQGAETQVENTKTFIESMSNDPISINLTGVIERADMDFFDYIRDGKILIDLVFNKMPDRVFNKYYIQSISFTDDSTLSGTIKFDMTIVEVREFEFLKASRVDKEGNIVAKINNAGSEAGTETATNDCINTVSAEKRGVMSMFKCALKGAKMYFTEGDDKK